MQADLQSTDQDDDNVTVRISTDQLDRHFVQQVKLIQDFSKSNTCVRDLDLCLKWLNILSHTIEEEKFARNCLVTLMHYQLKVIGRLSYPFNDLNNCQKDIRNVLEAYEMNERKQNEKKSILNGGSKTLISTLELRAPQPTSATQLSGEQLKSVIEGPAGSRLECQRMTEQQVKKLDREEAKYNRMIWHDELSKPRPQPSRSSLCAAGVSSPATIRYIKPLTETSLLKAREIIQLYAKQNYEERASDTDAEQKQAKNQNQNQNQNQKKNPDKREQHKSPVISPRERRDHRERQRNVLLIERRREQERIERLQRERQKAQQRAREAQERMQQNQRLEQERIEKEKERLEQLMKVHERREEERNRRENKKREVRLLLQRQQERNERERLICAQQLVAERPKRRQNEQGKRASRTNKPESEESEENEQNTGQEREEKHKLSLQRLFEDDAKRLQLKKEMDFEMKRSDNYHTEKAEMERKRSVLQTQVSQARDRKKKIKEKEEEQEKRKNENEDVEQQVKQLKELSRKLRQHEINEDSRKREPERKTDERDKFEKLQKTILKIKESVVRKNQMESLEGQPDKPSRLQEKPKREHKQQISDRTDKKMDAKLEKQLEVPKTRTLWTHSEKQELNKFNNKKNEKIRSDHEYLERNYQVEGSGRSQAKDHQISRANFIETVKRDAHQERYAKVHENRKEGRQNIALAPVQKLSITGEIYTDSPSMHVDHEHLGRKHQVQGSGRSQAIDHQMSRANLSATLKRDEHHERKNKEKVHENRKEFRQSIALAPVQNLSIIGETDTDFPSMHVDHEHLGGKDQVQGSGRSQAKDHQMSRAKLCETFNRDEHEERKEKVHENRKEIRQNIALAPVLNLSIIGETDTDSASIQVVQQELLARECFHLHIEEQHKRLSEAEQKVQSIELEKKQLDKEIKEHNENLKMLRLAQIQSELDALRLNAGSNEDNQQTQACLCCFSSKSELIKHIDSKTETISNKDEVKDVKQGSSYKPSASDLQSSQMSSKCVKWAKLPAGITEMAHSRNSEVEPELEVHESNRNVICLQHLKKHLILNEQPTERESVKRDKSPPRKTEKVHSPNSEPELEVHESKQNVICLQHLKEHLNLNELPKERESVNRAMSSLRKPEKVQSSKSMPEPKTDVQQPDCNAIWTKLSHLKVSRKPKADNQERAASFDAEIPCGLQLFLRQELPNSSIEYLIDNAKCSKSDSWLPRPDFRSSSERNLEQSFSDEVQEKLLETEGDQRMNEERECRKRMNEAETEGGIAEQHLCVRFIQTAQTSEQPQVKKSLLEKVSQKIMGVSSHTLLIEESGQQLIWCTQLTQYPKKHQEKNSSLGSDSENILKNAETDQLFGCTQYTQTSEKPLEKKRSSENILEESSPTQRFSDNAETLQTLSAHGQNEQQLLGYMPLTQSSEKLQEKKSSANSNYENILRSISCTQLIPESNHRGNEQQLLTQTSEQPHEQHQDISTGRQRAELVMTASEIAKFMLSPSSPSSSNSKPLSDNMSEKVATQLQLQQLQLEMLGGAAKVVQELQNFTEWVHLSDKISLNNILLVEPLLWLPCHIFGSIFEPLVCLRPDEDQSQLRAQVHELDIQLETQFSNRFEWLLNKRGYPYCRRLLKDKKPCQDEPDSIERKTLATHYFHLLHYLYEKHCSDSRRMWLEALCGIEKMFFEEMEKADLLDCQVSEWGAWSECDKSCGTGMMTRQRQVLQAAQNGGKHCPSLSQKRGCQGYRCHGHRDKKILREMALLLPAALSHSRHVNDSSDIRRNLRTHYRESYKHNRDHEYCVEFEVIKASKTCHKLPPYNLMMEGDRITVRCDLEALIEDKEKDKDGMGTATKQSNKAVAATTTTTTTTASSIHKIYLKEDGENAELVESSEQGDEDNAENEEEEEEEDDTEEDDAQNMLESETEMEVEPGSNESYEYKRQRTSHHQRSGTSKRSAGNMTPLALQQQQQQQQQQLLLQNYHCRGEGLSGRTTRWSALPAPSCRGKWLRLTIGPPKKCNHAQFIFV